MGEVTSDDVAHCIQRGLAAARARDAAECATGDAMDTDATVGLDRKARQKLTSNRDRRRKRRR